MEISLDISIVLTWSLVTVLLLEMSLFFVLQMRRMDTLQKEKTIVTRKGVYTFVPHGESHGERY